MKITWRSEWPALALVAVLFALAALQWDSVPARVPVHWGVDGRPDGWGSRGVGLLAMPCMALVVYVLMTLLPLADPARANYAGFAGAYRAVRLAVLGFLVLLQSAMIEAFHGVNIDMSAFVLTVIGVLFVVLGAVMGRLRPNWTMGIRTPWTLSSPLAWRRTHRAGGPVFLALGLLWVAAGFSHRPWALAVAMVAVLVAAAGLAVYSYVVWRGDPDRGTPGRS